ncbi:GAF and ANTAR domain-containing protein [Couchioplanes caeruleus]|uniref:ANTAR domain-containing protein n=3 Tax=Couchioplanes caeruleus TaxID=56438 RepID=A0A1K0FJ66_9ACTN|nr:GAF and ANTAR domain-containing protein [Couchioplanes caeruleus]OJF12885.1 hypothetical protein BG844_18205 [Couchioplanes caeruleus subsp. caeruleus]ROP30691.1 GAF domain-containing protein [Couchioplanes caeruleus]
MTPPDPAGPARPPEPPREQRIAEAFVALADSLADDFDLPDFLHQLTTHCLDLLHTDGAGVMLADPDGRLRLLASSSERVRLLELFEIDATDGPCLTAYHSGHTTEHRDLSMPDPRWTRFTTRARHDGYRSVHAIPMRLRGEVIGVLNLFHTATGPLDATSQSLGRALADIATLALLQRRTINQHRSLAEQLRTAFTTRLDIEQAKGLLAERLNIEPDEAFERLRQHARATNTKLAHLARDITAGRTTLPETAKNRPTRPAPQTRHPTEPTERQP